MFIPHVLFTLFTYSQEVVLGHTHSEGVRLTSVQLMILEMTALETPGCQFFEFALGTEWLN